MGIILKFAPWIALALLLVGVYAGAGTIVRHWESDLKLEGRVAQKAEDDAAATRLADSIQKGVGDQLDTILDQKLAGLKTRTIIEKGNIDASFKAHPLPANCTVPPLVFDLRNTVRRETGDTPDAGPTTKDGSKPGTADSHPR